MCARVDRIYTPLVTLWVFLSQVLSADHSCRCGDRPLDRPSSVARRAFVFRGDWCLLPGQKTSARRVFLERGSSDWTWISDRWRSAVALDSTSRLRFRWFDGIDARHAGEPAGLSATRYAETRLGLSPSFANRGRLFSPPAVRFLIWESAATQARDKASWGCYALYCGTCFSPVTSFSPRSTLRCARGRRW